MGQMTTTECLELAEKENTAIPTPIENQCTYIILLILGNPSHPPVLMLGDTTRPNKLQELGDESDEEPFFPLYVFSSFFFPPLRTDI